MTDETPVTLRLLLVESSAPDAELLQEALALTAQPLEVIHARSGDEALPCLEQRIDLVMLAVHFSGMDGFQVLRTIKADLRTHHIPVVVVGAASPAEVQRGLDLGAEAVLDRGSHFVDMLTLAEQVVQRGKEAALRAEHSPPL